MCHMDSCRLSAEAGATKATRKSTSSASLFSIQSPHNDLGLFKTRNVPQAQGRVSKQVSAAQRAIK